MCRYFLFGTQAVEYYKQGVDVFVYNLRLYNKSLHYELFSFYGVELLEQFFELMEKHKTYIELSYEEYQVIKNAGIDYKEWE